MKVALITDTHFGVKNDDLIFHNYFVRFYDQVFFPELRRRGITTVIHLGDLFERRKQINFHILYRTRKDFMEQLVRGGYDTHIMVGNHDTYFRDTNEVNSVRELVFEQYSAFSGSKNHVGKFHIYEEPEEVVIDNLRMLFVPWLNTTNMGPGLEMIRDSKASVLMGHLEIAGMHMDQHQISEHGLDKSIFNKYKKVFSGHFHHASIEGNVRYLGSPYEQTFADLNDPKGFYIFDTETLELEFILNPFQMFYRVVYDDRELDSRLKMQTLDFSEFENKYVRLIVPYKTDPILYEQFRNNIENANPANFQTTETYSLEVSEEADEQFIEFDEGTNQVVASDTMTIMGKYIDAIGMDIDKGRLKDLFRELYVSVTAGK